MPPCVRLPALVPRSAQTGSFNPFSSITSYLRRPPLIRPDGILRLPRHSVCGCAHAPAHEAGPTAPPSTHSPGVCARRAGAAAVGGGRGPVFGKLLPQQGSWGPWTAWGRSTPTSGTPREGRHTFCENRAGQGSTDFSAQRVPRGKGQRSACGAGRERVLIRAPAQVSGSQRPAGAAPTDTPDR